MSLTAPREASIGAEGAPGRRGNLGINVWVLCAEFVERIVSDAQAAAARDDPGHRIPEVDWEFIWQAGDGAYSDESAIGRIVRAASVVAHGIALGTLEPPSPPASADQVDGEAAPSTAVIQQRPAAAEPVTALVDPVTAVVEPVAVAAEPLTAPVLQATSVSESVTLDRPDPDTEQLPIAPRVLVEPHVDGAATGGLTRTHSEWVTIFTWIRNLGAIILLFVVWQLWGTAISQHQAQGQLKAAFDASLRAHHPPKATASGPSLIPASTFVPSGGDGSVVAHLQIPTIGVDQYVVEGTNSTDLSKGPGHYVGTAMPGQAGNVAIAGHRTTHGAPFNRLGQLGPGDRIILTTLSGESLTYVVSGAPKAVSPNDVAVLNYFGDNRITLTTCTPEFSSTQRLIVVGELKQPTATPEAAGQAHHVPRRQFAHRELGLVVAAGSRGRGLSLVAPGALLPALCFLVREDRQVDDPRPSVGGRPLSALRYPHHIPSRHPLTRRGRSRLNVRWQTTPDAPSSELSLGPVL